MININKRNFLKAGSIAAIGTLAFTSNSYYNKLLKNKTRETHILEEILQKAQSINSEIKDPVKVLEKEVFEEEITKLRKYAKNTPSKEMILGYHNSLKKNDVLEYINNSTKRFNILDDVVAPILCIEQGTPFKGANYGLGVESGTGCNGLGQLSFPAFFDTIKWYNEEYGNGNYQDSKLNIFLDAYRKYTIETLKNKKNLSEIILNNEEIIENKSLGIKLIENNNEIKKIEELAKKQLKEKYNNLFESSNISIGNKNYDSQELQVEIISAYLKLIHNQINNWDFTIGAYNHGVGTTKALISKYEGKFIPTYSLGKTIEENKLNYRKLYNRNDVSRYFNQYKEEKGLNFLDKEYETKVKIATLEIKLNS